MNNEIVIGLGGIVLAGLTYFAGIQRANRLHAKKDKTERINAVVDSYIKELSVNYTSGIPRLIAAGINNLQSDEEMREACLLIVNRGVEHPLSIIRGYYDNLNLQVFFRKAVDRGRGKNDALKLAKELSNNTNKIS